MPCLPSLPGFDCSFVVSFEKETNFAETWSHYAIFISVGFIVIYLEEKTVARCTSFFVSTFPTFLIAVLPLGSCEISGFFVLPSGGQIRECCKKLYFRKAVYLTVGVYGTGGYKCSSVISILSKVPYKKYSSFLQYTRRQ